MQFDLLIVSPDEFNSLTTFQDSPVDNTTPRVIYTDGSLLHSGIEEVVMAFSIIDPQQDTHLSVQERTDEYVFSAKTELMGLIAAIVATPDEQNIMVHLDNQSVVNQYQYIMQDRESILPRKRFRNTYTGLWAVLSYIVIKRQSRIEVEWICGHNNDYGNELADRTAKDAAQGDTVPWVMDLTQ